MSSLKHPNQLVTVESSARLHMGFFDLHGGIGRKFGSIGLSLAAPSIKLHVQKSNAMHVTTPNKVNQDKVNAVCHELLEKWGISQSVDVLVDALLPSHAGLGSGTQLALTLGTALKTLFDLPYTTTEIALQAGRGGRSGVGIATFDHGGVIVDGGRQDSPSATPHIPPLLARYTFPEAWRVLLVFDDAHIGVHGNQEKKAFNTLPVFPESLSAQLCHQVLMKAMPAIVEQDLQAFGESIQALQIATGDYFAPVQGGRYASKAVSEVLSAMSNAGVACFGQSSWGPTGFAIFESAADAEQMLAQMQAQFSQLPLSWLITQGHNNGANISIQSA